MRKLPSVTNDNLGFMSLIGLHWGQKKSRTEIRDRESEPRNSMSYKCISKINSKFSFLILIRESLIFSNNLKDLNHVVSISAKIKKLPRTETKTKGQKREIRTFSSNLIVSIPYRIRIIIILFIKCDEIIRIESWKLKRRFYIDGL